MFYQEPESLAFDLKKIPICSRNIRYKCQLRYILNFTLLLYFGLESIYKIYFDLMIPVILQLEDNCGGNLKICKWNTKTQ